MAQVRGYSCLCWLSLWLWHHSLSRAISYKSHIMISLFGHKWLVLFPDARLHFKGLHVCLINVAQPLPQMYSYICSQGSYSSTNVHGHHIPTMTSHRLNTYRPPTVCLMHIAYKTGKHFLVLVRSNLIGWLCLNLKSAQV